MSTDIQALIEELYETYKGENSGIVASYIPELARANPDWFGISIVTTDGTIYEVGESQRRFTIQSVSKPVMFGLALQDHGKEKILTHIGVEPTTRSFNSVILDERTGRPQNPMVNAGAIAIADLIKGADLSERLHRMLNIFQKFIGGEVHMDGVTFMSERATGHRNRAIAYLMRSSNIIENDMETALDLYFQQCSLLMNTVELATMAATLANQGVNPCTGEMALEQCHVGDVVSVMYTCGMYDSSGEWAYRVGLPAKSGVSGDMIAVVPGKMGIAVFSPPLNESGHSVRGHRVISDLSRRLCLHMFSCCDEAD